MKNKWFVGIIANQGKILHNTALRKVFALRQKVYGDLNWGDAGHDAYDDRSVIFAAINGDPDSPDSEIAITMRLIIGRPLPLEEYFPSGVAFAESPSESSRFVRNPELKKNKLIRTRLLLSMHNYARKNGHTIYGLAEDWLIDHMGKSGVRMEKITEGKALAHYDNTVNYVVEVKPKFLRRKK